ncbi:MAG: tape measure protein [Oscillospiraceae bacterium]
MASIQSQLILNDRMSGVLGNISKAMGNLLNNFEAVNVASGNAVNLTNLEATRSSILSANKAIEEMQGNVNAAGNSQNRFNDNMRNGSGAADGMLQKVKQIAATVAAAAGVKQIVGLSDEMAGAKARLSLIVDDGGSVQELQNKIFASAQSSRASYTEVMQSVSKLGLLAGKAFSGNDEMIKFAELMNKNFVIAGASASEQTNAMYQLNQAMASGRLQGDEYRSIIENAPLLATALEDYMKNAGVSGTLKEWAGEGLLTAEVIKNALFASADDVEKRFKAMPKTWGQVWTSMKNRAVKAFEPLLAKINEVANTPEFESMVDGLLRAFHSLAAVIGWVFELIVNVGSAIHDNWAWLEPVVWGLTAAVGAYALALLGTKIANGLVAISEGKKAVAQAIASKATFTATLAQEGFNIALAACPLVWIILLIGGLIVLLYTLVGATNKAEGTAMSATELIFGTLITVLALLVNVIIGAWNMIMGFVVTIHNVIADVANFLGSVFTDPIGAICRLFVGLADFVLGILQAIASAIDAIFGSSLSGAVQGWRDGMNGWTEKTFGTGNVLVQKWNQENFKAKPVSYDNSFSDGVAFGKSIDEKFKGIDKINIKDALGGLPPNLPSDISATADNTGRSADALKSTEEDLRYLRDVAEQEVINRFTTAEIKVEMVNNNSIASDTDIDGLIGNLVTGVEEAMSMSAEGVHV